MCIGDRANFNTKHVDTFVSKIFDSNVSEVKKVDLNNNNQNNQPPKSPGYRQPPQNPQPGFGQPQPGYGYPNHPPQNPGYGYPQNQPGYPPKNPGYGYPQNPQPGYGYPQNPQPGYGYPQNPQPGYGYPQNPQNPPDRYVGTGIPPANNDYHVEQEQPKNNVPPKQNPKNLDNMNDNEFEGVLDDFIKGLKDI